jgi:thymidylate kinase
MTGSSKPIRLEGFDGAGKSGLAKIIAPWIGAEHIEVDKFTDKPEVETPYRGCVRQSELDLAIGAAVASG